ncbi:class I SAM-dependent methyltransferase [Pseudomonas sp.]|uniref:class I SAM-dependent methyltransferase n=1 Tax=Pseudomonas sp. TaxID=306 RepID=UPI00257F1D69|nr:class I SAM-dependent methyltransferase [Pseudomonas sp.]
MVRLTAKMEAANDYKTIYDEYWQSNTTAGRDCSRYDQLAERIVMNCGIGRALDIGSGEGALVASLLRRGVDAHGLDVSRVVTEQANQRSPGRFTESSVLDLPFGNESFQTVVSINCLELLSPHDLQKALHEIHRIAARFVYVEVSLDNHNVDNLSLIKESRGWWESKFFEVGLRKHPAYYAVNPYESLNNEGEQIAILLEKIPEKANAQFPLSALAAERDLHMDMLREVGERSDAHVARYKWAEKYVRQGDRVLDAACGLGYGSYSLAELSKASEVTGVDGSDYAIEYARSCFCPLSGKLKFISGFLPECLAAYPDGHFDVIITFETLEHVEYPEELLKEFHRLLSPGGRIVGSVPNDWSDESGEDPNPFHLHVYTFDKLKTQIEKNFLLEAVTQQIASGCKLTSAWNSWQRMPRTLQPVTIDTDLPPPSEWWLMVGMKDPSSCSLPYRESVYSYSVPPANLLQFERDYNNPWLVRSLLEFQFRASDNSLLQKIAKQVLARAGNELSPDTGAALTALGYRLLENETSLSGDIKSFIQSIEPYVQKPGKTSHLIRFYVSLGYLKAKLHVKIGEFDAAITAFKSVVDADISSFSPTLGTKVVDASFELGLIEAGRGDIAAARLAWKNGVQRAYKLLSSDVAEFIGDIEFPHEFPSVVAVELLDSATRCVKALRITHENSFVPITRIYELTRENWKGMLEARMSAISSMESQISARDEAIASQARMLEERWATMEAMEALINERDLVLIEQSRLLEKQPTAIEAIRLLYTSLRASFRFRFIRILGRKR